MTWPTTACAGTPSSDAWSGYEAGVRLGDRAEALMSGQSWRAIRGLGNRLRHAYDRIDFTVIWGVITERLPALKADTGAPLAKLQNESSSSA